MSPSRSRSRNIRDVLVLLIIVGLQIAAVIGLGNLEKPASASSLVVPSLLSRTVTMSQSDILALCDPATFSGCTPYTLIPAPGAGLVVIPFAWRLNFNTTGYLDLMGNGGPQIWWSGNTNGFGYVINAGNAAANVQAGFSFASPMTPATNAAAFSVGNWSSSNLPYGVNPSVYTNLPLVVQEPAGDTMNYGVPSSIIPHSGAAGTGYVVGDQVQTVTSDGCAGQVSSIGAGGSVSALTPVLAITADCLPGTNIATTNVGNVTSATVTSLHGGLGYSNGDTGTISGCGNGAATYTVTASSGGVVSAVSISNGAGGYSTTSGCTTTVTTGGGNGTLELNVVAGAGSGLHVDVVITPGDGTVTVTIWYVIIST